MIPQGGLNTPLLIAPTKGAPLLLLYLIYFD